MKFIGYYNYTVVLTQMALASAVFGIYFAIRGNVNGAVYCLMLSGLCDAFDGKVARTKDRCRQEQQFGIQLDSLSDIVCFGVLPTVIGYAIGMRSWIFVIIFFAYVVAALTRLAYYNVTEDERQSKTDANRKVYVGLPVTTVALIIPLVYIFGRYYEPVFKCIYGIVLLVIAFAFVLSFPVHKPGNKGMAAIVIIGVVELFLMATGVHYGG